MHRNNTIIVDAEKNFNDAVGVTDSTCILTYLRPRINSGVTRGRGDKGRADRPG